MRLLIADIVRRKARWPLSLLPLSVMLVWWMAAELGDMRRAFAASMALAFALGPDVALQHIPRPIWYLPISRRDLWRSGWLVATVGATLVAAATKTLALVVPSVRAAIDPASLLLSTAYDFAATGIGCALIIIVTRPRPARGLPRAVWPLFSGMAEVVLPLGWGVGYFGAMGFGMVPPARWTDLTASGVALLLGAMALTVATYFYAPRLVPTAKRPPRAAAAAPRFGGARVTGLSHLLLREYAWALMIAAGLAGASGLVVVVESLVAPQDFLVFLRGSLETAGGSGSRPLTGGFGTVNLMICYAFFVATIAGRFPAMIRHLRVLPLGAVRLNALLVCWPAVIWLTLWAVLALLHQAVLGTRLPASHAVLFFALTGFSALVQSVLLRLGGVLKLFAFSVLAGIVPLLHFLTVPSPAALALGGGATLAAAALINHFALARTSTYRTPIGPFIPAQASR